MFLLMKHAIERKTFLLQLEYLVRRINKLEDDLQLQPDLVHWAAPVYLIRCMTGMLLERVTAEKGKHGVKSARAEDNADQAVRRIDTT